MFIWLGISKRAGLAWFTVLPIILSGLVTTVSASDETRIKAQLRFMGEQFHRQLEYGNRFYHDPALQSYLNSVLQRVADAAAQAEVHVLENLEPNAFISPGGPIYIHLGLLLRLEDEAELAVVLAHEAAHISEAHPEAHYRNRPTATHQLAVRVPVLGKMFYADKTLGFGQDLEFAADEIALKAITASGYDERAALRLYRRLAKENDPSNSKLARSASGHPLITERLARFRAIIDEKNSSGIGERRGASYLAATRRARIAGLSKLLQRRQAETIVMLVEHDPPRFGPHAGYFIAASQRILGYASKRAIRASLNQTLAAAPDFAPAHRLLGQLQLDALDYAGAASAFDHYLTLAPSAPDVAVVQAQLESLSIR